MEASRKTKTLLKKLLGAFLSESEYGKLQEYERTISDRIALMQIRQDLALNSQPLNEEQKKFLWQVLRDERSQIPALKYDPRNAGRMRENYRVVLESDNAARYFEAQAALDKRVLARAQTILSSEQYEALATVQRHHCELQETVVELARKALGNQAGKNAGTPPH